MIQYLITALAGLAVGIAGLRIWQSLSANEPSREASSPEQAETSASAEPAGSSRKVLIGAGVLAVIAVGVFALRTTGDANPESAPGNVVGTMAVSGPGGQKLDDVDTMISRLAARLEKEPNDGEGFRMLGWSYVMTGHPDKAIEPYKRALTLLPKSATVHAGYGEALTANTGNKVTPEAKAEFDRAIALDPAEPRSRYFEGLWLAQNGKEREALDKWVVLANSGTPDAPWQGDVRKQIGLVSQKLGVDVSARLKQSATSASAAPAVSGPDAVAMQSAAQMPEGQRQAMVDQMVEGLANKLKANPRDPEGWTRLLRSRMVLKQEKQAAADLALARRALAGDAASLAQINSAATQFGVPGAR